MMKIEDQDQDQNKDEDAGPFEAPFFPSRLCEVPLTKSHNVHVNRTGLADLVLCNRWRNPNVIF